MVVWIYCTAFWAFISNGRGVLHQGEGEGEGGVEGKAAEGCNEYSEMLESKGGRRIEGKCVV